MVGARWFLASLVVAAFGAPTGAPAAPGASTADEARVVEWLRDELGPPKDFPTFVKSPEYALGWADLDGDGAPEALVYLSGQFWCGSGGCHMYVLKLLPKRIEQLAGTTVTWTPIAVLPTRTNGLRDLSVRVCGGGIIKCYRARLQFEDGAYTSNPTVADPVAGHPREEVVIPREPTMRPLYPDGLNQHAP